MADDQQTPESPEPASNWVEPEPGDGGVTTETAPRHMRFVRVSPDELDDLKSSSSTVPLAFLGSSFGALITILITLATVDISDLTTTATFRALGVVFALSSSYFGVETFRSECRWRQKIDNLKNGSKG